jgi:dethiobiotin synthetase
MRARGFFVTGTDTDVGKTVLSALLCVALDAVYWKPVQTGAVEGTDTERVRQWAGLPAARTRPEAYRFDPPVSPHLAARWAGVEIALERIRLPEVPAGALLVAEGAGGALVPLNERALMVDLMRQLGLPVLIAARSTLGTINHTLLTVLALRQAGLEPCGVVLIGPPNDDNRAAIEHYGRIRVLGQIPVLAAFTPESLRAVFAEHFDRPALLGALG